MIIHGIEEYKRLDSLSRLSFDNHLKDGGMFTLDQHGFMVVPGLWNKDNSISLSFYLANIKNNLSIIMMDFSEKHNRLNKEEIDWVLLICRNIIDDIESLEKQGVSFGYIDFSF